MFLPANPPLLSPPTDRTAGNLNLQPSDGPSKLFLFPINGKEVHWLNHLEENGHL